MYDRRILGNVNGATSLMQGGNLHTFLKYLRTSLNARRVCAHAAPPVNISFLADCILILAEVSFND